eukprot:TRINITY_DN5984_c0_g1_i2.p1 TRINITY_DN5984_c0_g1~~TRINITY_DN5984_c0_g1_i2.p1  ORF type:complete len:583 (+),score=224.16 TRINITY_DN5984_c0_g1_i2:59-1807(+)
MVDEKAADDLFAQNVANFETMRAEIPNDPALDRPETSPSKAAEAANAEPLEAPGEDAVAGGKVEESEEVGNARGVGKKCVMGDGARAHERLIRSKEYGVLFNCSDRITKLKQINGKLQKELKALSATLSKSSEKPRLRQKASESTGSEHIKAKERELDAVQKQMQGYQREIALLKEKLAAKTGYEKIIDIENVLKDGEMKTQELLKQERTLKGILRTQEKELEKLKKDFGLSEKLKSLSEELRQYKEANKELEKKMQAENQNYQKCHTRLMDLQSKAQNLKEEKLRWKKAVADKVPAPPSEVVEETKRSDAEILQESLGLLQKRLRTEKAVNARNLKAVRAEVEEYEKKIKEAEQEARLNTDKLSQLRRILRFRQLSPLEDSEKSQSKTTQNEKEEAKKDLMPRIKTKKHLSIRRIEKSQELNASDIAIEDNKEAALNDVSKEAIEESKQDDIANNEAEPVMEDGDKSREVQEATKTEDSPIDKEFFRVYNKREEMEIHNVNSEEAEDQGKNRKNGDERAVGEKNVSSEVPNEDSKKSEPISAENAEGSQNNITSKENQDEGEEQELLDDMLGNNFAQQNLS